jgi:hypothetical protein
MRLQQSDPLLLFFNIPREPFTFGHQLSPSFSVHSEGFAGFFVFVITYSSKEFRQPCNSSDDEPSDHDSDYDVGDTQ